MALKTLSLFSGLMDPACPVPVEPGLQGRCVQARVAVAPCKHLRGFRGDNLEDVRAGYLVRRLRDALTVCYRTDAHLVTYLVSGARRQPRINKVGLASFPGDVVVESFFCDVDNAGHASWDRDLTRAALDQFEQLEVLHTTGLYFTRRGRRLVQPLAAPLPVLVAERVLARWLASLEIAGLEVDWACRDWTRHFRLPHVVRDGRSERAPILRLERMQPVVVPPADLESWRPSASPARTSGVVRVAEPRARHYGGSEHTDFDWTTRLDPAWMPAIERIAEAVRQVETEWHSLFLAVAGAMLARGAEPEDLPLLCRAVSMATGADDRPDDREAIGRSTAERSVMGLPVMGLSTLQRRWPEVAAAFVPVEPLRFRELVDLLQEAGGSRALAQRTGLSREALIRLLRGGTASAGQLALLRTPRR